MSEMKTFVFTDIVQSVDLKGQMAGANDAERDEAFVSTILTPHRARIERGLAEQGGRVVSTAGDGHFLVFGNTISAAGWAVAVQQRHRDDPVSTPAGDRVAVRMSLHVGFPQVDPHDENNFIGRVVDYAARLNDHAASGQILISSAALGLLRDASLDGVTFHTHGTRDLRGIGTVEVHELLYEGTAPRSTRTDPSQAEDAKPERREWTVLPATMGLTEFAKLGSSSGVATSAAPVERLGKYELGELLGSGGMGAVYRARHTQFDRDRAVKIIKPELIHHGDAAHEEIIRRFYREIKAIGGLDHPNIAVAIDSSSPEDDTHYLVMEYLDGVGADALVEKGGPLPFGAACEIVRQAAGGLEYLHRQGMVHRDIKPSNLMLTLVDRSALPAGLADSATGIDAEKQAPVVKILDLGLALLVTDDQDRLTQIGHGAMGTAMYMSPEQWNTTSVDIRSDIYSLGCTLYHLVAGRPPFFDSDLRPQRAHEKAPVPTEFGRGDAPKALISVIKKTLAKRPDDRYARPTDLIDALAPLADADALAESIDRARRARANATTRVGGGETISTAEPVTDTLGPLPPQPLMRSWDPPPTPPPRPLWRKLITPVAVLAAVGAVFWVSMVAGKLQEAQQRNLIVAAQFASSQLASEIDTRFEILARMAADEKLRSAMTSIDVTDRTTWSAAQQWIEGAKGRNDRVAATSWFLVYRDGTQVARAKSSTSIGKSYAYRDYFHGMGYDLEKGATAEPILGPHQSAVYRSTSTNKLKVAFSVPVWRGAPSEDPADVIGVLGMSVDLGSFRVLEDAERLPKPLEVVLVDLRPDALGAAPADGDPPRRGLLLHHPELAQYEVVSDPFRLAPDLLAEVDAGLRRATRTGRLTDPIIRGYNDLLRRPARGAYVGAFEPVVIRNPDEQREVQWLVIVQQEE